MATDPISVKPLCRLCTVSPQEAAQICEKCKQCFCASHLKEHTSLFQESRALLKERSYFSEFACDTKEIKLLDLFIEKISMDRLFALVSNFATHSLEVQLYPTKIPLKIEAYLTQMSKPKNITELSTHINRNFTRSRYRA